MTPDVLIISGLDPSGGAGFIADTRVVHMLGGRPVGAVTTSTVQNTQGVRSVHDVDAALLGEQLNALLSDVEVRAVKIGMIGSIELVGVIDEALQLTNAPVVWDPIAAPTLGAVAFGRELLEAGVRTLAPHLTLMTPNTNELALLTGAEIATLEAAVAAGTAFARANKLAVLVKGGHLAEPTVSVDVLCTADGELEYFRAPRIASADVHGTGCALSSAIATYLARGESLVAACRAAKQFVAERIAAPVRPGQGAPAVM